MCSSYIRSGYFDWVLAKITQASEWILEKLINKKAKSSLKYDIRSGKPYRKFPRRRLK